MRVDHGLGGESLSLCPSIPIHLRRIGLQVFAAM